MALGPMRTVLWVAALAGVPAACWAQASWRPEKAVEIVITTAPGGSNDQVARLIQKIWQDEKLVTAPVLIVNKPGGNQTVAMVYLTQHAADPHHLLMANPTVVTNHIAGITPLSPSELTPIALLLLEHTAISVRADSPIRNIQDLVTRLKADPESWVSNWRAIMGPKGMTPAQVAFWEEALAKMAATDEWKKQTEAREWGGHFMRSREFAKYLDAEYAAARTIMTELGLAKQ